MGMTVRGDTRAAVAGTEHEQRVEPFIARFNRMLAQQQAEHSADDLASPDRPPRTLSEGFPFTSLSMFIVLACLFLVSVHLGGWTWSSWTYAFSLGIVIPLTAIEIKRRAVVTGAAMLLISATAMIAAGLPQYFGYSPSDLSWYDLLAHYLGALTLTVLLWSILCWARASGAPSDGSRTLFFVAIAGMLVASVTFEMLEFYTDAVLGWTNFHAGVDTVGDIIFDVAGVASAAVLIARHRIIVIRKPFWHVDESTA